MIVGCTLQSHGELKKTLMHQPHLRNSDLTCLQKIGDIYILKSFPSNFNVQPSLKSTGLVSFNKIKKEIQKGFDIANVTQLVKLRLKLYFFKTTL